MSLKDRSLILYLHKNIFLQKSIQDLEWTLFSATPWKQEAQNIQTVRKRMHSQNPAKSVVIIYKQE